MPGLTLAIETSNPSAHGPGHASVAARVDGVIHTEPVAAGREDDLMPAIDRLFRRLARTPRDTARIAVSIGPGGFTALRVSITVAKSIAFAVGAPCIAVPTAHALAAAARRDGIADSLAVLLASKGDSSFAAVFPAGSIEPVSQRLITAADLDELPVTSLVADQFLPETMQAKAAHRALALHPPRYSAAHVLELGESLAARHGPTPIDALAPLYPREPEAVTKWRQLHPESS
ncbi:MAG TPA: tRNA (adenosine(37)-N6)-threonylcarbamoyltransferase complex dimerization subunit type 1 TsaB [Phycisphaerales bacterium]